MAESIIFISGKPGAGKSTCCRKALDCSEAWTPESPAHHLSVGELFRSIYSGSIQSRFANEIIKTAEDKLAPGPDHMLVHSVVMEQIDRLDAPGVMLIDGYPKEPELIPVLREANEAGLIAIRGCVVIDVCDEVAISRQASRSQREQRSGFGIGSAADRVKGFNEITLGVARHLQSEWGGSDVNGSSDPGQVSRQFIDVLNRTLHSELATPVI